MDILTYALARRGGSGNGALTGLQGISINGDRQLVLDLGNGNTVTSEQPIPAASEEAIITAITNNKVSVQNTLEIPAALSQTIQEMKSVTDVAVTGIQVGQVDNQGNPLPLAVNEHTLNLPLATSGSAGLVKSAVIDSPNDPSSATQENINKIYVNDDGTMSVYTLNVNRLIQTKGDELILEYNDSID